MKITNTQLESLLAHSTITDCGFEQVNHWAVKCPNKVAESITGPFEEDLDEFYLTMDMDNDVLNENLSGIEFTHIQKAMVLNAVDKEMTSEKDYARSYEHPGVAGGIYNSLY